MNISEMRANATSQLYKESKLEEANGLRKSLNGMKTSNLKDVKGLGPASIKALVNNKIKSQADLLATPLEDIKKIVSNPMTLKGIENFLTTNK